MAGLLREESVRDATPRFDNRVLIDALDQDQEAEGLGVAGVGQFSYPSGFAGLALVAGIIVGGVLVLRAYR